MQNREPCPDRIIDDVGGAFAMGSIGGAAVHFYKGLRRSPRGERFVGGIQSVRMNAPRIGGSFGVWGGLFSTLDCSLVFLRRKEDPWNSIISGAATGGILQMRQGLGVAGRSALFGAAVLALIEGFTIMLNKAEAEQQIPILGEGLPPPQETAAAQAKASSSSSWFGDLFGGGKEEEKKSGGGGGVKTEILESFDTPVPPTFEFD